MEEFVFVATTVVLVSFFVLLYLSTSRPGNISFWQDTAIIGICSLACLGSIFGSIVSAVLVAVTFHLPLYIGYVIGAVFFLALSSYAWWKAATKL